MNEHEDLNEIERRLEAGRPVPSAAFRGQLRRQLVHSTGPVQPAPRRLRLLIAAYAGSGTLLLVVAAAGVAGLGPLAA